MLAQDDARFSVFAMEPTCLLDDSSLCTVTSLVEGRSLVTFEHVVVLNTTNKQISLSVATCGTAYLLSIGICVFCFMVDIVRLHQTCEAEAHALLG